MQTTLWELTPEDHTVCAAPDPEPCKPEPKPAALAEQPAGTLSWDEAFELYHDYQHSRRIAQSTIYCHQRTLTRLRDALRFEAPAPLHVTLGHLRRYQLGLLKQRRAAGTVANATARIRGFFSFLTLDELLPKNPAARLEPPRVPPRPPGDVLSPTEVQRLLEAAAGSEHPLLTRAVVETLYCTGVRRNELLAFDLYDLDHAERTLLVRAGKGEKPRVLPVAPTCYDALSRYLEFGRPELEREPTAALLLGSRGRRLTRDGVRRMLLDLQDQAGVTKRVTPHTFRRSCATGLLKTGANLRVIQTILGHTSLETTSSYLCLNSEEIREEVLTHHPRERFAV